MHARNQKILSGGGGEGVKGKGLDVFFYFDVFALVITFYRGEMGSCGPPSDR